MRFVLVLALTLVSCTRPIQPPVNPDASDGSAAVDGAVACTAARDVCAYCAHMRSLHCTEGEPTALGVSCEVVTANTQRTVLKMDLGCRATATTCQRANTTCR